MTRENCACDPQVTKGVNKICSQFVLCRIRRGGGGKHYRNMLWFICLPFAFGFLFTVCTSGFYFCFISALTIPDSIIANVLRGKSEHVCSGSNGCFLGFFTGQWVTSNQQLNTTASKRIQSNKLNQITRTKRECERWHRNYWSWGNWQDQQQASVLHMACHFHSFHKENTKSVISHYLRLINNNPDMLNRFSAVTKTWGKWSRMEFSVHRIWASSAARRRAGVVWAEQRRRLTLSSH